MTDWMRIQDEKAEAFEAGRADECASWQHSLAVLLPPEFDCTPDGVATYIRRLKPEREAYLKGFSDGQDHEAKEWRGTRDAQIADIRLGGADLSEVENPPKNPLAPERRPELRGDRHE